MVKCRGIETSNCPIGVSAKAVCLFTPSLAAKLSRKCVCAYLCGRCVRQGLQGAQRNGTRSAQPHWSSFCRKSAGFALISFPSATLVRLAHTFYQFDLLAGRETRQRHNIVTQKIEIAEEEEGERATEK